MNKKTIYTDGACSGNPGKGGWGFVVINPNGEEKGYNGGEDLTTNNRMELTAAIEALKTCTSSDQIDIYTDSTYVKNGITDWINGWKRTNWKNGKVKNIDLWQELDTLNNALTTNWYWVKGHSGDKYNDIADELATSFINGIKVGS